ncbi:MAG: hypothetical protein AAFM91_11065 [Pseudomonadota bacterium]
MHAVLSALLAALAILVPLATSLLPAIDAYLWQDKLLLTALILATLSLFCVVHVIIALPRKGNTYKPKEAIHVPVIVNGTWFVLVTLAISVVLARSVAREQVDDDYVSSDPADRFSISHDLPKLGSTLDQVVAGLGRPSGATSDAVYYQLATSSLTFCFDADRQVTKIFELKEISEDAISRYCVAD